MGDEDDVAGIVDEMLFEPLDALGVEMVGRLVEQQDVGLFEQQPGQRDAALLAAREVVDRASPGGQRSASIAISSWLSSVQPSTASIFSCKFAHLGHQRVEIGVLGRIGHQRARSR